VLDDGKWWEVFIATSSFEQHGYDDAEADFPLGRQALLGRRLAPNNLVLADAISRVNKTGTAP
jgi:hypothetical protein